MTVPSIEGAKTAGRMVANTVLFWALFSVYVAAVVLAGIADGIRWLRSKVVVRHHREIERMERRL